MELKSLNNQQTIELLATLEYRNILKVFRTSITRSLSGKSALELRELTGKLHLLQQLEDLASTLGQLSDKDDAPSDKIFFAGQSRQT